MDFQKFYLEVEAIALTYGYSATQINMFKGDVLDCYNLGKSVEETVAEVF
jgi:hypothetical protein